MEANSGDTSTTPLTSPTTQTPLCLPKPCPVLHNGFQCGANKRLPDPVAEGGGTAQEDPRCKWTVEAWGGMKGEGGCILASDTKIFFPLLAPQPPPSCGFMAYLPVADFHLAMSGDLWQICCRDSDRGSRRKGISSRETVLDRMTRGGTCKFWGNLTPLGGPLRCEHRACKIVQKIVWAKLFKGKTAQNLATWCQMDPILTSAAIKTSKKRK